MKTNYTPDEEEFIEKAKYRLYEVYKDMCKENVRENQMRYDRQTFFMFGIYWAFVAFAAVLVMIFLGLL